MSGVIGTLDESPRRRLGFLQHALRWRNPSPPHPPLPQQHHHSPPSPPTPAHPSWFSSSSSSINLIFHKFSILTWHHHPQLHPDLSVKSLENSFSYYLPVLLTRFNQERGVSLNISHKIHDKCSLIPFQFVGNVANKTWCGNLNFDVLMTQFVCILGLFKTEMYLI